MSEVITDLDTVATRNFGGLGLGLAATALLGRTPPPRGGAPSRP